MKKIIIILFVWIACVGCQASLLQLNPMGEDEGELFVYLNPLPQEASRLTFMIDALEAVSTEGERHPLTLRVNKIEGARENRQQLLASGALPHGPFSGLSIKVKSALLKEKDEKSLDVPSVPVSIDFSFTIGKKRGVLLILDFNYKKSIQDSLSFYPSLSASLPPKPLANLTGFVTNYHSDNITMFDRKTGRVSGIIELDGSPAGMTINQVLQKVYVTLPSNDEIAVIDITAGEVTNRIRVNGGDQPWEIALTPDRKELISVNRGSNTVSFLDPFSYLETERIGVGKAPQSILIDRSGKKAFVFNTLSNTASVIDIPDRRLLATITTESAPIRGQFNSRGDKLYIIHELSSYVLVLDVETLSTVARYYVGMGMTSLQADQNSGLFYLGRKNETYLGIYDPFSFTMIDSIRTGGGITYSTIDGTENNLLMVCPDRRALVIANLTSRKILSVIDVGEDPYWVIVMGERRF